VEDGIPELRQLHEILVSRDLNIKGAGHGFFVFAEQLELEPAAGTPVPLHLGNRGDGTAFRAGDLRRVQRMIRIEMAHANLLNIIRNQERNYFIRKPGREETRKTSKTTYTTSNIGPFL
jgi:hypothetical protein